MYDLKMLNTVSSIISIFSDYLDDLCITLSISDLPVGLLDCAVLVASLS